MCIKYNARKNRFLTRNIIGDTETFYYNVLDCYLAPITKQTIQDFKCGLGIYNMQGFEHKNK